MFQGNEAVGYEACGEELLRPHECHGAAAAQVGGRPPCHIWMFWVLDCGNTLVVSKLSVILLLSLGFFKQVYHDADSVSVLGFCCYFSGRAIAAEVLCGTPG